MSRRIDFTLFEKEKKETVSGGMMQHSMRKAMSVNEPLQKVLSIIEPFTDVFWVTNGEWSAHELLMGLLNITGPAMVHISSFAMGETPARILAQLKNCG